MRPAAGTDCSEVAPEAHTDGLAHLVPPLLLRANSALHRRRPLHQRHLRRVLGVLATYSTIQPLLSWGLVGIGLQVQIVTGIVLAMHYTPHVVCAGVSTICLVTNAN
jgi:quinol-cytochrome oxidoreductase complex cytochrome b subunit